MNKQLTWLEAQAVYRIIQEQLLFPERPIIVMPFVDDEQAKRIMQAVKEELDSIGVVEEASDE